MHVDSPMIGRPLRLARNHLQLQDFANYAFEVAPFQRIHPVPAHQIQLHTTRSIALHKEPEVVMTHSGIAVDVLGAGLDLIPQDKARAILAEFPRLSMKKQFLDCLCSVLRQKPATSYDNVLRDIGTRYVKGYTAPTFADLLENAPFAE